MDTTSIADLAAAPPLEAAPFPTLKQYLRDQELTHIRRALEQAGGDKKRAGALLGISLATLYRKLDPQLAIG